MEYDLNTFGQPVGLPVDGWTARPTPPRAPIEGNSCRLEPLDARHAESLFEANALDAEGKSWTYLPYGPFIAFADYHAWVEQQSQSRDPLFFAIIDKATNKPVGVASYLRIDPNNGVIEVGHIHYSPRLQRTRAATEAMYLMMAKVFELGYRRYEWKCDALNAPSRSAAERLGFTFEGIFRQAVIVKGRQRDTAWYSITDKEWPAIRESFLRWLDPANIDDQGNQELSLRALREQMNTPRS